MEAVLGSIISRFPFFLVLVVWGFGSSFGFGAAAGVAAFGVAAMGLLLVGGLLAALFPGFGLAALFEPPCFC